MKREMDEEDLGWLTNQVELMKTIHGYEKKGPNDDVGGVDYVARDSEVEKLLTVVLDPKLKTSKVDMETIRKMIDSIEEEGYGRAIIIAEDFTYGAKKLIRKTENLDYVSPGLESPYSLYEMVYAIQRKTMELCESICGKTPSMEACGGLYREGPIKHYTCQVRRVSDDSDFHADMGWKTLLYVDFSKLVKMKEEMGASTRDD
jgi:hypothetical protein